MIKILGNRIMVSKVEEAETDGFGVVEVQDSFVNKGLVVEIGEIKNNFIPREYPSYIQDIVPIIKVGEIVLFAKYSPDTQEIKYEGKDYKIVSVADVLAIL